MSDRPVTGLFTKRPAQIIEKILFPALGGIDVNLVREQMGHPVYGVKLQSLQITEIRDMSRVHLPMISASTSVG